MNSTPGLVQEPLPLPSTSDVRQSENDIERVISFLPVMAWYCRVDRCRSICSASFVHFTGNHGRAGSWRESIHPDDVDRLNGLDPFEALTQGHIDRTVRVRSMNDNYFWHEVRGVPVFEESTGVVAGWVFTATDMEPKLDYERDRASHLETLSRSEQRLKLATEAARIGVFDSDLIDNRIHWSGSMGQIAGLSEDQFPQAREEAYSFIHPEDRPLIQRAFEAAVAGSDSEFCYEFRGVRPDGEVRYLTIKAKLIRDADGRAVRSIGTMMDITETQADKQAVWETKQRLQATYDSASVGIAEIDRDGRIIKVNDTWKGFTGLCDDALIGRTFLDAIPNEIERGDTREQFDRLVAGEIESFAAVREGQRPNGDRYWFDTHTTAVRDREGRFLYAVRTKRDITEAHIAHEQERLLLAELTHRVKNTIATIQAISSQTIQKASSLEAFNANFLGRLHSISATHSLLIEKSWIGVGLSELLRTEMRLLTDISAERWTIDGPDFEMNPSAAVNIGLLMHELVSNARSFGAFSDLSGEVAVTWEIVTCSDDTECLRILWRERGGPTIDTPRTTGFGTRLLKSFTRQLQGSYLPVYAPAGLTAEIVIPTRTIRLHPNAGLMRL